MQCTYCGAFIRQGLCFCPSCGKYCVFPSEIKSRSYYWVPIVLGCGLLLAVLVFIKRGRNVAPTSPQAPASVLPNDKPVLQPTTVNPLPIDPSERLRQAKAALEKKDYRRVHDLIDGDASPGARRIIARLSVQEKKEREEAEEAARVALAKGIEQAEVQEGNDMYVRAEGPKHTVLRVEWILISRPFVYRFLNTEAIMNPIKSAGFKKLVFANGAPLDGMARNPMATDTWTYDVEKNKLRRE